MVKIKTTKSYVSKRKKPLNLFDEDKKLFESEFSREIPETFYKVYKNITLEENKLFRYGSIALDPKFYKMDTSNWNSFKVSLKQLFKNSPFTDLNIIDKGSWVIDDKSQNYFHWMTDVLSRIKLIPNNELNEYPILVPKEFLLESFISETLELLNIPYKTYDIDKKVKINHLLVTSHAAPAGNYNNQLIHKVSKDLKEKSKNQVEKTYPKKIWLSRKNQDRRVLLNEEDVTKYLSEKGYEVIYPESISISEQINLFNNAEIVISLHGASLTNIMHMNTNKKILEIRIFSDKVRNAFFSLASEFDLSYYYFLADAPSPNLVSDLSINLIEFKKLMNRVEEK